MLYYNNARGGHPTEFFKLVTPHMWPRLFGMIASHGEPENAGKQTEG